VTEHASLENHDRHEVSPTSLQSFSHAGASLAPTSTIRREVNRVLHYLKREDGQTMAEYGVVLAVITLLVIGAFMALSGAISSAINAVADIL
jgi:Flp pilus assembly pilin Flp